MRLCGHLPWAITALLIPLVCAADNSGQVPFTSNHPTTQSTTLVDVLSADPDYHSLLRLLQRARLIPTLNKLNGSTLFAPTNEAIKRHAPSNSVWQALLDDNNHDSFIVTDNIQEQLRQQLFYHLLNYSLPVVPTEPESKPQVHKTLHFPRKPIEPPTHEPPPLPPWMPIPGGTLGGKPQRVRIGARDDSAWVGVDAFAKGGAQIVKGQSDADNGVIFGIDDVLQPPADMGELCRVTCKLRSVTDAAKFQRMSCRRSRLSRIFTKFSLRKLRNCYRTRPN